MTSRRYGHISIVRELRRHAGAAPCRKNPWAR
jgi:hypothetical protein